ncbi:MAG: AarF/UbiB family protein [Chloroflexota bacterium]|nr:AarF/UbiB family protein [Chloroflexota bacterium]
MAVPAQTSPDTHIPYPNGHGERPSSDVLVSADRDAVTVEAAFIAPSPAVTPNGIKPPLIPNLPPLTLESGRSNPRYVRDTLRALSQNSPRTLRLQIRFARVIWHFGSLFAKLLFWHWLVAKYAPERVERGNLKRWMKYARAFRYFAIDTGGVMIKLGQFISTRGDILPIEIIDELASLRDEVPSVEWTAIRAIIERELGAIPMRYSHFDDKPVAAASLGQVHRARLLNGERVVVKVQRPGIAELCYTDLSAMFIIAHVAKRFRFINRRMDTVGLIEEFGRVLLEELSYTQELDNARRFARMFRDDMGVYIPAVYAEHSTERVITIEDVTSLKIDDYAALQAAGIDRKAVAKRLMDTYLKQIFEERFFHADPHPGNLFIYPLEQDNGQDAGSGRPFYLIFIDFGMTGTLTPQIVNGLLGTMGAVLTRDSRKLIESYSQLGFLLPGADLDRLEEATRTVFDQVWGLTMQQMSSMSFDSMANIGAEFNDLMFEMPFQVPQDFIYLGRTVSILGGMSTTLDPTFNPWSEMQPYMQKMITAKPDGAAGSSGILGGLLGSPFLGNLLGGNAPQALLNIGQSILGVGQSNSKDALARLERGDLKIKVDASPTMQKQLTRIEGTQRRTYRAVVTGSLLITSTLFYTNGDVLPAVIGYVVTVVVAANTLLGGE